LTEISSIDAELGDCFDDFQKIRKLYVNIVLKKDLEFFKKCTVNEY